jgi:uncharacterized membrane protein YkoI
MNTTRNTTLLLLMLTASGLTQADRRTSLEDAVSEARDRYPGRVISAETRRNNGHESHNIRILTDDGRVKRLNIDAESGRPERRRNR